MLSIVPRPLPALPTYPCTPIVVTFLLSANLDRIYLGHTVAIYPGDPLSPTPADNSFVVLVGSQAESCIALALHDDATRKVNAAPVATIRLKGALAVIDFDGCITADEGTSTL